MSNLMRRGILQSVVFGGVAAFAIAVPNLVSAQVTCYVTRCAVYPDGVQICERTPVTCSSIKHWL